MASLNSFVGVVASNLDATRHSVGLPTLEPCADNRIQPNESEARLHQPADSRNVGSPAQKIVASSRKWLPPMADELWPIKPAVALHDHIGGDLVAKLRTCYDWCAGDAEPPAHILIKLLHSAEGWHALEFLMRDCTEPWWIELQRNRRNGKRVAAAAFE